MHRSQYCGCIYTCFLCVGSMLRFYCCAGSACTGWDCGRMLAGLGLKYLWKEGTTEWDGDIVAPFLSHNIKMVLNYKSMKLLTAWSEHRGTQGCGTHALVEPMLPWSAGARPGWKALKTEREYNQNNDKTKENETTNHREKESKHSLGQEEREEIARCGEG